MTVCLSFRWDFGENPSQKNSPMKKGAKLTRNVQNYRGTASSVKTMSVVHNMMSESWQHFLRHRKNCQLHQIVCLIKWLKLHALSVHGSFQTTTTCAKQNMWCKLDAQPIMCMHWTSIETENGIKWEHWKKIVFSKLIYNLAHNFYQQKLIVFLSWSFDHWANFDLMARHQWPVQETERNIFLYPLIIDTRWRHRSPTRTMPRF